MVALVREQEPSSNVKLSLVDTRDEDFSHSRTCYHISSRTLLVNREFEKGFIDKIVGNFRKAVSSLDNFEKRGELSIAEPIGLRLDDCS